METATAEERMSEVPVDVAVSGHAGGKDLNGPLQNGGSLEKKDDEIDAKDLANGTGVGGILGSRPEELLKAAQNGWDAPLPRQAERRVNRGPRPDFSKERNAVNDAEAALKSKRDKQELITAALRLKQVTRQEAYDNLKSARSRLRDINAEVTTKHLEMDPLQEALKKLQEKGRAARDKSRGLPASSEDELDRRIAQLEFRMHHESIPLSEEKSIMREIKALQSSRTEVRALGAMQIEHADGQGQREALQARLQPLQMEEKALRLERDAARKIVENFEKEAHTLEDAVKELLAERSQAITEHQKAYEAIKTARSDFAEARRLAAAGEYTGPTLPRRSLAEDVADLEKAVGRPPHIEQNGGADFEPGSTTGFDEAEAPVAKPYKPSRPAPKPKVAVSAPPAVSAPAPPKVVVPVAAAPAAAPVVESKPVSPVAPAPPPAAVEAPSKAVEVVPQAPVEPKKTQEELAAEEAAAKERRRQEELEKAREAEDRKKKAAERTEAKARARAAKEAEEAAKKKERAEEKKARKKAAAAPGAAGGPSDGAEDSSPEGGEGTEKPAPASEVAKAAPVAEDGDGMRRRKKGAAKSKASMGVPSSKLMKRRGDSWWRSSNVGYSIFGLFVVVIVGWLFYSVVATPKAVYASSGEPEK